MEVQCLTPRKNAVISLTVTRLNLVSACCVLNQPSSPTLCKNLKHFLEKVNVNSPQHQ